MNNNLIYSSNQYDALLHQCIYHAVFAYLEEYGKEEDDFIQWLSHQRISFDKALDDLESYLFRYIKKLHPNAYV